MPRFHKHQGIYMLEEKIKFLKLKTEKCRVFSQANKTNLKNQTKGEKKINFDLAARMQSKEADQTE